MSDAGFNILKSKGLLKPAHIRILENKTKKERNIYIGKLMKKKENRKMSEELMQGFIQIRKEFFEDNDLNESDILSIKKDAIFVINKTAFITNFDGIEFKEKNVYSSYFYINGMEFYFSGKKNELHIKGISDDTLLSHDNIFVDDLKKIFSLFEKNNKSVTISFLRRYRRKYLEKSLPTETYRELNKENFFRLKGRDLGIEYTNDIEGIDITYNYIKILVPIISYVI